ncbi:hypothetical protein MycrhDRAFT_5668 [Mycolicibacterium rhodesiae JS60]|nr:hypothetical protein MycrhDRAFT_5668 [Mycolicibacterium rhodesiae JS60]
MAAVKPATIALRKRLLAALHGANGVSISTPELCRLAGFNNFEHHAYVLPQLRSLARVGVVTRTAGSPGAAVYWRLNGVDQTAEAFNARLEHNSHKETGGCRG